MVPCPPKPEPPLFFAVTYMLWTFTIGHLYVVSYTIGNDGGALLSPHLVPFPPEPESPLFLQILLFFCITLEPRVE